MQPFFILAISFILGLIFGSFFNVCIYRIPKKESVSTPGSHCSCGKPIAWYDNIPVLSWLILRGKARCCKSPFSIRYPLVELLTGLLFLGITARFGVNNMASVMYAFFASLLIIAFFIDLDTMEIPDRISLIGIPVALLISFIKPSWFIFLGPNVPFDSIFGICAGTSLVAWVIFLGYTILKKEAMGWGDAKLLGFIGAFLGWKGALFSFFGGAILGTIALIVISLITRKSVFQPNRSVPFGPMIIGGAFLYMFFGPELLQLYLSTL